MTPEHTSMPEELALSLLQASDAINPKDLGRTVHLDALRGE